VRVCGCAPKHYFVRFYFYCRFAANLFSAVRALLRRWPRHEFEDNLTHGQRRALGWALDSFFRLAVFIPRYWSNASAIIVMNAWR
jgi:hypothetical protein